MKAERIPFINISDILIDYRSFYKTLWNLNLHSKPLKLFRSMFLSRGKTQG